MTIANDLVNLTLKLGATGAKQINTRDIVIDDDLAELCRNNQCENFGLSANCPPHTSGPAGFRELLGAYQSAIFFKIEAPAESLQSEERGGIFKFLQEVAATVERAAVEKGYDKAKAFAGGSCKQLFCDDQRKCDVLDGGDCRYPDSARPSMSGFGIDVSSLMELCGWKLEWHTGEEKAAKVTVCGLVLLG